MDLSLALLRHRLAARRDVADAVSELAPRPDGLLLRVHLGPDVTHDGAMRLLQDLQGVKPDLSIVVSGASEGIPSDMIPAAAPRETGDAVRAHLDHWRPDTMLFSGPEARPVLWTEAARRGIPMVAVDADPRRHALALVRPYEAFDFVHSAAFDRRLRLRDFSVASLAVTAVPPAVIDSDLADLSEVLTSRPVWLSAGTPDDEIGIVLDGHVEAAKLAHRLLLVLELSGSEGVAAIVDELRKRDLKFAVWSEGEDLAPDTQVLIADEPGEIGLWARLASICYLAGSFTEGVQCDPLVPASLGSVIVHGPVGGDHADILRTLDSTHGAVRVAGAHALGEAVESLLSPERSAKFAHEAWDIATRGAEASNRAIEALDRALTHGAGRA